MHREYTHVASMYERDARSVYVFPCVFRDSNHLAVLEEVHRVVAFSAERKEVKA